MQAVGLILLAKSSSHKMGHEGLSADLIVLAKRSGRNTIKRLTRVLHQQSLVRK